MPTRARGTAVRLALLTTAAGALVPVGTGFALHAASTHSDARATTATSGVAVSSLTATAGAALAQAHSSTPAVTAPQTKSLKNATRASATDEPAQKPVIVGPLLDFLRFGAGIGAPLVCQAGTSGIGSGAQELGVAEQAAPVIAGVNDGCDKFATQGVAAVDMFAEAAAPASALNPYVNPGIEASAVAAETYGEQYGEELAPFGPTVVGSGGTIRWFEGR